MKQGTIMGWLKNSPHIMLMNKCRRFCQAEYSRVKQAAVQEARLIDHVDTDARHDPNQSKE